MERDSLENLGIDEGKILRWFFKEIALDNVRWIDLSEEGQ